MSGVSVKYLKQSDWRSEKVKLKNIFKHSTSIFPSDKNQFYDGLLALNWLRLNILMNEFVYLIPDVV